MRGFFLSCKDKEKSKLISASTFHISILNKIKKNKQRERRKKQSAVKFHWEFDLWLLTRNGDKCLQLLRNISHAYSVWGCLLKF